MSRSRALALSLVLVSSLPAVLAGTPVRAEESSCSEEPKAWGTFPRGCDARDFAAQARAMREAIDDSFRSASGSRVVARFSSRAAAAAAIDRLGVTRARRVGRATVLDVPEGRTARGLVAALRARADVVWAELDHRARAFGQQTDWGATAMNVPEAHLSGATGSGVTIAIVDSGVDYTHEDLDANIWTNPGEVADNGLDDDGNGYIDDIRGWDTIGAFLFISPDNDPMDTCGHGTHVAGIAAAEDNDVGILGVAPDATIMPVRVLDDGCGGWDSNIAEGIYYAVDNGADIINMSIGGYFRSSAMREAVEYAYDNDVTVVAAAGNDFFYSIASFPAGFPSVISVSAASEEDESRTWWSNWGNADFIAPGENVLSSTPDDVYEEFSGTSMASPHVAGALALVAEANPGFGPDELEQALASTADDRYAAGVDPVSGSGFPDVEAATGALPATQMELYRDAYLIPSDGETASTVTVRLLDANGDPIVGEDGTFSTDVGTLSETTFTTDANGEDTTVLTVEDHFGLATITADTGSDARDLQVIVEDDRVRVNEAFVIPTDAGGDYAGPIDDEPLPKEGSGGGGPILDAGDEVQVVVFLGNRHFNDSKQASFTYEVRDPDGNVVDELSGESDVVDVGFGGFGVWISEERVASVKVDVPDDAAAGRYELSVTATTDGSGLTDSYTRPFWVGETPEVLVIRRPFYFNTETFNYFDFSNPHINWGIEEMIEDLDLGVASWDTGQFGEPTAADLRDYSTVIWLGDWDTIPNAVVNGYLKNGGNILLSAEQAYSYDRLAGSSGLFRDRLHVTGLLTQYQPHLNHQVYPAEVGGIAGGPFDGETFDIDSHDLGMSGEPTAIFVDELVTQEAGDETEEAFGFAAGRRAPYLGGIWVDDGSYRALSTSFGIEAIDDESSMSVDELLETVLDGFNPPPAITDVTPGSITEAGGRVTITGDNFQETGTTVVKIAGVEVPATVLSRTTIRVDLPWGFPRGIHNVRVTNPFGDTDVAVDALRVTRAAPEIAFVDPGFASNDRARAVRVYGAFFRPGADVTVAGVPVAEDVLSAYEIRITIPTGLPLGAHNVRVVNPDGRASALDDAILIRYGFTTRLGSGDSGTAVAHLQRRLRSYGYFPASQSITGFYGNITEDAVRRYQRARDLTVNGVVDAPTRAKLNNTF